MGTGHTGPTGRRSRLGESGRNATVSVAGHLFADVIQAEEADEGGPPRGMVSSLPSTRILRPLPHRGPATLYGFIQVHVWADSSVDSRQQLAGGLSHLEESRSGPLLPALRSVPTCANTPYSPAHADRALAHASGAVSRMSVTRPRSGHPSP